MGRVRAGEYIFTLERPGSPSPYIYANTNRGAIFDRFIETLSMLYFRVYYIRELDIIRRVDR